MLQLLLQFSAGRYHATPWGRHVNEGEVEWPPSPLRLCRALVSVGFNRLGWTEVPEVGHRLLEALSRVPPTYHLPPATAAHTRHYMPQFKGNTSKVLDAFAYVGRDENDALGVTWDVELTSAELALLDELLRNLTYLGRAESWIEARRVEVLPGGLDACAPADSAPAPGYERIPLLAALPSDEYAAWREAAFRREKEKRFGADGTGKKGKGPSKKALAELESLLPADVVEALCVETSTLQKQGWNQPPGTRWLSYWRRDDALTTLPAVRRVALARPIDADTALFALASNTSQKEVLPPFTDAIRRLESLHDALVKRSSEASDGQGPSPCFTGRAEKGGAPLEGHRHATLIPLCLDRRAGRLDHVLVHAPMKFDPTALAALRQVRKTWAKGLPDLYVTLVGLGTREDFAATVSQLGTSRIWRSVTPFVPPRFLKARGASSLEGQVQAELASRGLPAAVSVEIELEEGFAPAEQFWAFWSEGASAVRLAEGGADGGTSGTVAMLSRRWRYFRRERQDPAKRPPISAGIGLRLAFDEPVRGPVALGYASHFGLGQFVPADGSIT